MQRAEPLTLRLLIANNIRRFPSRSFTTVLLLALGTFVLVMTAANKKDKLSDVSDKTSGTGGFDYIAETTIPILRDLNDPSAANEYGIPEGLRFVSFISTYDDDASCLNLNRIANPRILATDLRALEGRFRFVSKSPLLDAIQPWLSVEKDLGDVIPVVVDQTVLEWGMGKKVGDTLSYVNHKGLPVKLLVIGGLANSIFQGNVLMSLSNFRTHFREKGGADFILIENTAKVEKLDEELGFLFKEYGWITTSTRDRLAEFGSIENTYLNIFFLMGAFALLLGTIGLAVRIVSSLIDRRKETAILRALGFSKSLLVKLFAYEYLTLFLTGTLIGLVSALLSTLPTLISGNQTVAFGFVAFIMGLLLLNGLLWMVLTPMFSIGKTAITAALRND